MKVAIFAFKNTINNNYEKNKYKYNKSLRDEIKFISN